MNERTGDGLNRWDLNPAVTLRFNTKNTLMARLRRLECGLCAMASIFPHRL